MIAFRIVRMTHGGVMVVIEMMMMTVLMIVNASVVMGGQVMQKVVRHFQRAVAEHHRRIKNKQYGGTLLHPCKDK